MKKNVTLVGAGPGDPELLTLKALRAIEQAEVVLYDRLVSDAIMALVPPAAERIFVGKSCKEKAMPQADIEALLICRAREGKRVVRLKGGDPFLFGRGGEEALALSAAGVDYEVVPGITSAQGVAAVAGIPLTHRGFATGVRFVTGHREAAGDIALDWQSLADPDTTLVVYMGLKNIGIIAEKLMEHGLPGDMPAAAVMQGTLPNQQVVLSTLMALPAAIEQANLQAPTLIIIGKVAALSQKLHTTSFETGG